MKFLKFSFLPAVLLSVVFAFSSCGDDDDTGYLPPSQAIQDALKKLYPNATAIKWEQKGVYYVADCQADGREKEVWFDANANWLMTETELNSINNLPPAVLTAFMESSYNNWVVDDVVILEYPNEPSTEFVVTVEQGKKVDLYFSEGGGLLHEKDVTNGDDTHWPRI